MGKAGGQVMSSYWIEAALPSQPHRAKRRPRGHRRVLRRNYRRARRGGGGGGGEGGAQPQRTASNRSSHGSDGRGKANKAVGAHCRWRRLASSHVPVPRGGGGTDRRGGHRDGKQQAQFEQASLAESCCELAPSRTSVPAKRRPSGLDVVSGENAACAHRSRCVCRAEASAHLVDGHSSEQRAGVSGRHSVGRAPGPSPGVRVRSPARDNSRAAAQRPQLRRMPAAPWHARVNGRRGCVLAVGRACTTGLADSSEAPTSTRAHTHNVAVQCAEKRSG